MTSSKTDQSPATTPDVYYGYIVVVAAFLIMLVAFGSRYAFGVFFKPVLTEFGWTRASTAGAFSLSMFIEGLLGIAMGGLNDRFGPRRVLTFCGFLAGLSYLLMSQINSIWQLYLFYGVIMGIGMSGVWVPILSTIARWFIDRRSTMSAIVITGTGVGTLIAPPAANWLISKYDWRFTYILMGIVVFLVFVLAAQFLKRDPSRMGQANYGEGKEGQSSRLEIEGFSFKEAFNTGQFWMLFAMFSCLGFCMFTIMIHIVPHTTDLGISAVIAVKILATIGGVAIIGRIILGIAADRVGNRRIFLIGFILLPAAFFWLVPAKAVWMFYIFAIAFSFAQGGMGASESPLVAEIFGLRSHGLIFGFLGFGFTIGAALGPLQAGYIYDLTYSYQAAFFVCGVIGIVGLILTGLLTPIKETTGSLNKQ